MHSEGKGFGFRVKIMCMTTIIKSCMQASQATTYFDNLMRKDYFEDNTYDSDATLFVLVLFPAHRDSISSF